MTSLVPYSATGSGTGAWVDKQESISLGVGMGASDGSRAEALLPRAVDVLDDILRYLRSRHGLSAEECEDFGSLLKIKLLDNDRAVLRAYRGESSLRTYLGVVAQRLFLDYRVSQWGKWRPSAAARRAGSLGIELERLLRREGRTLAGAIELMAARHAGRVSRGTIEQLAEELRLGSSERASGPVPVAFESEAPRDSSFGRLEREELAGMVRSALATAFERLPSTDRLVLRMHYQDGLTLASVARSLGLDQRELYRRLGSLLATLRASLEKAGVRAADVAELLGRPDLDLSFRMKPDDPAESPGSRPSNQGEP